MSNAPIVVLRFSPTAMAAALGNGISGSDMVEENVADWEGGNGCESLIEVEGGLLGQHVK
jgi:hypothetical protein